MTREQILAMPAGRELDALVAVHVMGWTRVDEYPEDWKRRNPGYHPDAISPWTGKPCASKGPWWIPPGRIIEDCPVNGIGFQDYSTDISAAWLVVEKMIADGWECEIAYSMTHKKWECDFNNGGWLCEGPFRDTAPHAIVITALLAKLNTEGK